MGAGGDCKGGMNVVDYILNRDENGMVRKEKPVVTSGYRPS